MEYNYLILQSLTVILITLLVLYTTTRILEYKKIFKTDHQKTISELLNIIEYKCENYSDQIITQLQNMSLTNREDLINHDKTKELTALISAEVILLLSKEFKKKLKYVIGEEYIDLFITEIIFNMMVKIINNRNLNALKKIK